MRGLFRLTGMVGATAVLTLSAVGSGLASSEIWEPPRFELNGFGGWVHYDLDRSLGGNLYGGRIGYNFSPYLGVEGQFGRSGAETPSTGAKTKVWFTHADGVFHLAVARLSPFIAAGAGGLTTQPDEGESLTKFKLDAGGGVKIWLTEKVGIRADYRSYWGHDDSRAGGEDGRTHDYTGTVGLTVGLGTVRRAPPDADLDGVPDGLDLCALTPIGVEVDTLGCPVDNDGDGVPDYLDYCSVTPVGAIVDERGCPTDSDHDRIPDGVDQCPGTPREATVDMQGCPRDGDGDGILDGIDQCQGTPEGIEVDASGCPKAKPIEKKLVLHGITFETASSEILPESYGRLDRVVESLKAYPDVRIEIRGYADSRGTKNMNLRLTQERAESVRDYFVSQGIEEGRLEAKGYGEEDPIASNDTEEGRALNRRVELHRIERLDRSPPTP